MFGSMLELSLPLLHFFMLNSKSRILALEDEFLGMHILNVELHGAMKYEIWQSNDKRLILSNSPIKMTLDASKLKCRIIETIYIGGCGSRKDSSNSWNLFLLFK